MSEAGPLFTRIDAVVLRVRDLAAARAWYTGTLGLTATYEDPALKLAVLDMAGGTSLTLWELGPGEGAPPGGGFPILGVDGAEEAHRRLPEGDHQHEGEQRRPEGLQPGRDAYGATGAF